MLKTYKFSRKALKKPKGSKPSVNITGSEPKSRSVELIATILKKIA